MVENRITNILIFSDYNGGAMIRWDSPNLNPSNLDYYIVGVNVYRAYSATDYTLLNSTPVTTTTYSDTRLPILKTIHPVSIQLLGKGERYLNIDDIPVTLDYPFSPVEQSANINATSDLIVTFESDEVSGRIPVFGLRQNNILVFDTYKLNIPNYTFSYAYLTNNTEDYTIAYYSKSDFKDSNIQLGYMLGLVIRNGSGEDVELWRSDIYYAQPEPIDYIWQTAAYYSLWLYNHTCEQVHLLKRKYTGVFCPNCFEQMRDFGSAKMDCTTCYGTGILGGYNSADMIKITPMEFQRTRDTMPGGYRDAGETTIETLYPILISVGDIIIRQNGDRYVINGVEYIGPRGNPMVQSMNAMLLPRMDLRYKIPVVSKDKVWSRSDIPDWLERKTKTRDSHVEHDITGKYGDGLHTNIDESLNSYEYEKDFPDLNS